MLKYFIIFEGMLLLFTEVYLCVHEAAIHLSELHNILLGVLNV